MMRHTSISGKTLAYVVLVLLLLFSVLPTIYMIDLSLRDPVQSFQPVLLAPHPILSNYTTIFKNPGFMKFFLNSAIVSVITVLLTLTVVVLASFGLSRIQIRGHKVAFYLLIAGMMVPLASLIVPLTVSLKDMNLLNNYFGLIGPFTAIGTPFGMLVLKGAMDNFPRELEEAAVLDGATSMGVLLKIVLPTVVPPLLVVAIWQFLYSWNEFFLSLVVMTNNAMKTVPLLPLQYQGPYMTDPGALFAILTVISVVPMVVYVALQKWFVSGLMAGSVKG